MKKKKTISAALATALALNLHGQRWEVLRSQCPCLMLTCRLWQVRFSKSTILLILQLLPRLLPHKPMRLKAGLLIPTSLKGGEILEMADGWLHLKSTDALTAMRQSNPSSSNNWPAVAVWGTGLRLLQGRLLPRHHQVPAGRRGQPLRLLPGLQRPGQRPVHRLRFRTAGSGRPTPVAAAAVGTAALASPLRAPTMSTTFRFPGPTPRSPH